MNAKSLFFFGSLALMMACSNDNDLILDDKDDTKSPETETGYPVGSIVRKKDTTVILDDHFLVEKDKSLYIEEGATIIASNSEVKPEIVVLGNLYCLGTASKPITFTVEESSKTDRFSREGGGIICGVDSKEVYMDHVIVE